jgi:hypothetical protein
MERKNTHVCGDSVTSSRPVLTLLLRSKLLPSNMASAAHNEMHSISSLFGQTEAMVIHFERLFSHLSRYFEITLTNKITGIRCHSHRRPCIRNVKTTYVISCITCHFRFMNHIPWPMDTQQRISHLLVD